MSGVPAAIRPVAFHDCCGDFVPSRWRSAWGGPEVSGFVRVRGLGLIQHGVFASFLASALNWVGQRFIGFECFALVRLSKGDGQSRRVSVLCAR